MPIPAAYWDARIKDDVRAYADQRLPPANRLLLPSGSTIDNIGYANTLNENGPIHGLALQRVNVTIRCGGNNTVAADETRDCMQVGNRIFIVIYENAQIGNQTTQSPVQCPFPDFHKAVLRDLRMIATTNVGRSLLTSLDQSGGHGGGNGRVVIKFLDGFSMDNQSKVDFRVTNPGGLTTTRVAAASSTFVVGAAVGQALVGYNPMLFGIAKITGMTANDDCLKAGKWGAPEQKTPDVTLFHELIHADDALRGIFEPEGATVSRNGVNVKLSELRAVGLDAFGGEAVLGLNAAAKIYCENTYRAERGFVLRPYYSSPNETRGAAVITARMEDFLSYLDPSFMVLGRYVDPALMTMAEFRTQTKHKGDRVKIVAVENALQTYNRDKAHDPNPLERIRGLHEVLRACHAYKNQRNAKRNVSGLMRAAGQKVTAISTAWTMARPTPPTPAFYKEVRALRGVLMVEERNLVGAVGMPPQNATADTDGRTAVALAGVAVQGALTAMQLPPFGPPNNPNERLTAGNITSLQADDIQQLTAMAGQVPAVTALIIAEMIAVANQVTVTKTDTSGGSSAGPTPGGHNVVWGQNNPDDIRLGTYIHELTHVSTHQSFNNTGVMFSFAPALGAVAIKQLEQQRTTIIQELIQAANTGQFSAYQRYWMTHTTEGKLGYALRDGMQVVGLALNRQGNVDPAWTNLWSAYGAISQVLWEYDTVINQCLIYMHMWGIPLNDPLYTRFRTIGQELYDARLAARTPPPVILPPPVVVNNAPPPLRRDLGFFGPRRQRAVTH